MAWAALGKKLATGMVKGKAKKIAADKLLNRKKKKTVAKRPTLDELIADVRGSGPDQTKGGALAVRPTTSLVPTAPSKAITSGGSVGVEDTLTRIKIKVISIDQVLKGTLAAEKARKKDAETATLPPLVIALLERCRDSTRTSRASSSRKEIRNKTKKEKEEDGYESTQTSLKSLGEIKEILYYYSIWLCCTETTSFTTKVNTYC